MPVFLVASPLVEFGLPALAVLVAATFVGLVAVGARRLAAATPTATRATPTATSTAIVAGVAVFGLGALALRAADSGVLLRFDLRPPPAVFLFGTVLAMGITLGRSRVGAAFAALPLPVVVGFQSFRLPLELVMHRAAEDGVMPAQMSYGECNFDILTGVAALVVSVGLATGRLGVRAARLFQWLGLTLLTAILVIALLSTPLFRVFGDEPARVNTWVFTAPYVLLPATLVLLAIVGHVALSRALAGHADAPARDASGSA